MQERIAKFILTSDDPEIIIDLRKTNGRKEQSNFNEFWDKIINCSKNIKLSFTKEDVVLIIILPLLLSLKN